MIKLEILNKKASYNYFIENNYEAGIVLKGSEIKSIRDGKVSFQEAYITIKKNEVFIKNMHISYYEKANLFNHDEKRERKLLLKKKEIVKLKSKIEVEGYTIIPIKLYFKKQKAKILIGLAKGKKEYDKRETIKKRDVEREKRKLI